jgi:hypothetical protein
MMPFGYPQRVPAELPVRILRTPVIIELAPLSPFYKRYCI